MTTLSIILFLSNKTLIHSFYTARRQVLCISTPLNDLDLTKSSIKRFNPTIKPSPALLVLAKPT
jgi:hypothetical protein